ncbi:MAG: MerC domain-containing protein, partial [Pseudomonadota bacterium]
MTAATPQRKTETTGRSSLTPATDRAAVALSLLCIVHCVALPVMALALPVLAVVGDMEWVHWVFAVLAVLASSTVVAISPAARTLGFLIPAGLGASLVVFGLFAEQFGIEEAIPTVIGGVLLAFAH